MIGPHVKLVWQEQEQEQQYREVRQGRKRLRLTARQACGQWVKKFQTDEFHSSFVCLYDFLGNLEGMDSAVHWFLCLVADLLKALKRCVDCLRYGFCWSGGN